MSTVPCIGCHTNCCQHYLVTVTAHDIFRISRRLALEPASFLELHEPTPGAAAVHLAAGSFSLALRQGAGGACIFLLDIEGQRRCSIQSHKPRACAIYPFTMDEEEKLWHRAGMLCPTTWNLGWSAQQAMKAEIRTCRAEIAFNEALVTEWNERRPDGDGIGEYLEFALGMVARAEDEAATKET